MRNKGVNPETNLHTKLIAFIKLANIHLNHFPKYEKYGLCTQIRTCMYELFNLVTECNKRYHKKTTLTTLDIRHEQLRMLFKLAHELGYYNYRNKLNRYGVKTANRRYLAVNRKVDEIGAMIGGWIKKEKFGEGN